MFNIVILLSGKSGRGSNMASLAESCASDAIPNAKIIAVVGTHPLSPALERASALGLSVKIVSTKSADFDSRLSETLSSLQPDLICLAGYMRKIPPVVLANFDGRIINIHPALLPSFGGQGMYGHHVHEAVLAHGCKISGCSVHFVDGGFDTGPIILQKCVPILESDTTESLAARVLESEHQAYSEAVNLIAQGRVIRDGQRVRISPVGSSPSE